MNMAGRRTTARAHSMPFGAELQTGGVRFRIWAPAHERMALRLDGQAETLPLERESGGWHTLITPRARAGSRYQFVLPDGVAVPDPASRYQPEDVHAASEVMDPKAYRWHDLDWHGRPWREAVVYELHVGCFTEDGSYEAARERLRHLAELGVTALEIMPLSDFPGRRNWGYDGVLPFAPDASYGQPDQLKALVDAAHSLGLMVLIDVVYNHFGPEGNYLGLYAPQFFSKRHHTPWGAALNFDGRDSRPVREFVIHNALYWLDEFHCDGLRLDAVHAILDDSPLHILAELAQRVRSAHPNRQIHLLLENEHNEARWLERGQGGGSRLYDAQWNDDVHHVLHTAATDDAEGYYADYLRQPTLLGRALAEGFAFQGELMPYRGSPRGEASAQLPPDAFVAFLQNHDQVGNRALGERISLLASPTAVRAVTAVYLLLPQVPMLFMGEEWYSRQPFLFFCDFGAELGEAVVRGRRQEFARFAAFQDEAARERIPDPQQEQTFRSSKLDWNQLGEPEAAATLSWYRDLLAVRRRHIVPLLPKLARGGEFEVLAGTTVRVRWRTDDEQQLALTANLGSEPVAGISDTPGRLLWQEGHVDRAGFGAWSLRWSLRS
jgi:maltooligosyltrehalose trehalohydrolase